MKSWHLIAPDWASLDTIWRSSLPFVLWPVCEKPLLSYWLDEAVRAGVASVSIEAEDRPHLLRHWLDQRDMWSRSIEVHSRPGAGAGKEVHFLDRLPQGAESGVPKTARDLMNLWFGLQVEALGRRSSGMVHLDHEYQPGVWFGPGARAAVDVVFFPPCWVGSHAKIGPGCRIGPRAFVGRGVFLDKDVEVAESVVCAETYVGSHTTLHRMAAQGGLLMDLEKGVGVEVLDDFVLSPIGGSKTSAPWSDRLIAALASGPLHLLARALNHNAKPSLKTVVLSRSKRIELHTYAHGPLCLRRAGWLRHVARGELRLAGILPRTEQEWESLPAEARSSLEQAPAGVFALSDLFHCHSPRDPDEWMHAVFQAGAANAAGQRQAEKSLLKIALTTPVEP